VKPVIKPPFQNRLVCSNCGCKTSYETDGRYEARCRVVMDSGGVYVAFCDFCELLLKTSGGSIVCFGRLPIEVRYATGIRERYQEIFA
jgi:hypothetical protein